MQSKIYWMMGGSGSGKSAAANVMREAGICVIDADEVAHSVLLSGGRAYDEVVEAFGKEYLLSNGEINRRELGKYVFANPDKLQILNEITHKHIKDEISSLAGNMEVAVIDAPLPPEGFMKPYHILYIIAPKKVRIERISKRDNISEEDAALRLENQKHIDDYINYADTIIENDGDLEEFKQKIKNWCEYEKII